MASATKRGQGRWLGRYRDPSGRERTKTFPTKGEALTWGQEQERKGRRGEWTDPSLAKVTVGEWAGEWLSTLTVRPTTRLNYEGLLRNHVLPRWRRVRLDQVTSADVRKWMATMQSTHGRLLGASKRRQAFVVLSSMLDLAVEDGRLAKNPARPGARSRGMLPKLPDRRDHTYLTHDQLLRLAEEIGDYRAVVLLMGYCGLRWGEVRALRVCDVDLLHNRVTIARAAVEVDGGIVYDSPKSHAVRTVVPPSSLRAGLEPWMAGKSPSALLFTAPEGGPMWTSNFCKRQLDQAAKRAGLSVTPHDLRHTAASLAISSGANVLAVQRMLGHASAAMTLDTYAGLFDSDLEAVAGRLDEAISGARADSVRTAERIQPIRSADGEAQNAV